MFLSENEAKTKRCQEGYAASNGAARDPATENTTVSAAVAMTSVGTVYGAGSYGITTTAEPKTAPIFCLASACMAWRWRLNNAYLGEGAIDRSNGDDRSLGYCGKAGRPPSGER
jgi:hypothetical protein